MWVEVIARYIRFGFGLEQDIGLGLGLWQDTEFWTFGLGLGQDIDLVWVRARSIGFRLGLRQDIRVELGLGKDLGFWLEIGQDIGFNRLHLISNLH